MSNQPNDFPEQEDAALSSRRLSRSDDNAAGPPDLDPAGSSLPKARRKRRGSRLAKKPTQRVSLTPEQRLLILDTWRRSGLPAADFAPIVGVSMHSLYKWKKLFNEHGPAGLARQPKRSGRKTALSEITRRSILMLKDAHPDWGCQRISDVLARGPALGASPQTVSKVLKEEGYELEKFEVSKNAPKVTRFEREEPSALWQTDLFSFMLKRQNRRVYLVAFLDDHSRFVVSYGLHASQSTALVLETFRSGITSYGPPKEVLTDNGSQYVTWRGKSAFAKECTKRGIKHIVATPRHPQTLGKTERFWGTLWREFLDTAVFMDLADAQKRIGHFIDWYNFQRPHQGIKGLAPADRFFGAAEEVKETLKNRIDANALEIARNGEPKNPFYLTGAVGGRAFSVHAEGERVFMRGQDGRRKEVELASPLTPDGSPVSEDGNEPQQPPGTSPLDPFLNLDAKEKYDD